MFQKLTLPVMLLTVFGCLQFADAQSSQRNSPPPSRHGDCGCAECNSTWSGESGTWIDDTNFVADEGCDCAECVSGPLGRFGHGRLRQGRLRGRVRNIIDGAGGLGDCNGSDCRLGPMYLSIFAGGSFIDDLSTRDTFDSGMPNMLTVRETGFSTLDGVATGGSIGRYIYRQARTEFEFTFRDNGIGDLGQFEFLDDVTTAQINDTFVSSTVTPADGNLESFSFMFNFVGDLRPRTIGRLNPYLGGGIGVLYVEGDATTATQFFNVEDSSFAFQGIVGINYPFRDRIDLYSEYRYLGADAIGVERTDGAGTVSLGDFEFDSHNIVFGIRFLR